MSQGPSTAVMPPARRRARSKRADLICASCDRCFSKPEHLMRHERVHSGAKPFACLHHGCCRRFNRPDSLARHEKTHKADNDHIGASNEDPTTPSTSGQDGAVNAGSSMTLDNPASHEAELQAHSLMFPDLPVPDLPTSIDPYPTYMWPESEDLFALLTSNVDYSLFNVPVATDHVRNSADHSDPAPRTSADAHQAVRYTSSLLREFSFKLSSEVEAMGLTAEFLDICLGCFFTHVVPVFPVLHEPTFSLTECIAPLLLNMIALGSLFVTVEGATIMGEALWQVAHATVATSWQSLLSHTDAGRQRTSMQLVMTALLSQAYAVLSGNGSLRLTSQASRGLGFFWARESEVPFSSPTLIGITSLAAEEKMEMWRNWAAQEVRSRVLLGHYILDGLISQSTGLPSSARHTINNMALPCSDEAFDAPSCDDWLRIIVLEPPSTRLTFRELLLELFNFDVEPSTTPLSHMSVPVVMEALESLISESREAGGPSVGLPTRLAISRALWRLMDSQIVNSLRPLADVLDLSIRWHVVCISMCVEPRSLMHALCRKYGVNQKIYRGANTPSVMAFAMNDWKTSPLARRAMLHALAVLGLVQQVSLSKMRALHIPSALHSAAIILIAVADINTKRAHFPDPVCWRTVCESEELGELHGSQPPYSHSTSHFLKFGTLPTGSSSKARSITIDINTLQTILQSTTSTWGIAREMHQSLKELMASHRPIL